MGKKHSVKSNAKLLTQFTIMFIVFMFVTIVICGLVTYSVQMKSYREMRCQEIRDLGEYLNNMVMDEATDFVYYTDYYRDHYKELRIPYDFNEFQTSYKSFSESFVRTYPGQALHKDIEPYELSDELQNLYYTYRHEYWLLAFEEARTSFDLPYVYFLTINEDTCDVMYQLDGERTEDKENPGYLYMGDSYHNPRDNQHKVLWDTWDTGVKQDGYVEWDNDWGHTYSYYTPLVINGEKIGLIVTEVDVDTVNDSILHNSIILSFRLAGALIVLSIALLFFINGEHILRIKYLSGSIENYDKVKKSDLAREIREHSLGGDEIGILASETADMLDALEEHELEVETAARMKTDFLANMSHEIRTPMNAVIGMAEMTLREDIPDAARGYIAQIKSSGRALLTIINDILDFSKIESGKMEILPVEYEPLSLFNDVVSIALTRLEDKMVDLDLDIDTAMPYKLYGDNIRIRQILINLANNAAKFTEKGHITISVKCERKDDEFINMKVSVEDTGIGIKKENLAKIFDSFSQVDSKRNRNVEGTGLGLAISQRLVQLMDGDTLHVESEYGKGSRFWFEIPQKIVDPAPAMSLKEDIKPVAMYILADDFQSECFVRDTGKLGIPSIRMNNLFNLEKDVRKTQSGNPGSHIFVFVDSRYISPVHMAFMNEDPDITAVLVMNYTSRMNLRIPGALMIRKPVSAMNLTMLFNGDKVIVTSGKSNEDNDFIAPEATVLIVDDNAVNLTIAEGLLAPLKLSVMTASSGMEAVKMTTENTYDIVFMDHMMPEMDGVEATHAIRNSNPAYNEIPIIALTANAVGEAREMLMSEGMDDFIAKPIEVHNLISKVKEWLPPDKIKSLTKEEIEARKSGGTKSVNEPETSKNPEETISIEGLEVSKAVQMLGSSEMYLKVLKEYYRVMDKKTETVRTHFANEDWSAYTIEVHALKSTSRQIGAQELADMAAKLEDAGKAGDVEYIRGNTEEMLSKYMSYKPVIAPYCEEEKTDDVDKPEADVQVLKDTLAKIKEAADDLDFDAMESSVATLAAYSYPDDQNEMFTQVKEAVANMDPDTCVEKIAEWEKLM